MIGLIQKLDAAINGSARAFERENFEKYGLPAPESFVRNRQSIKSLHDAEQHKYSLPEIQKITRDCLDAYLAAPLKECGQGKFADYFPSAPEEKAVERLWQALYLAGKAPKPSYGASREERERTYKELLRQHLVIFGDFGGLFGLERDEGVNYSRPEYVLWAIFELIGLPKEESESYHNKFSERRDRQRKS